MRRALITGASGFVGRHLSACLAERGIEVHCTDRILHQEFGPNETWHDAEIADAGRIKALVREVRPDCVFHLAALTRAGVLSELLAVNVIGTDVLLQALAEADLDPIVMIAGSSAEYGGVSSPDLPIREEAPLRPLSPYGLSKAAQGMLAFQCAVRLGLRIVRTRTFNLTGPGEPDTLVCSAFAKQIAEIEAGLREPFVETGNLKTVRDFVDVRDAVAAYTLLADKGDAGEAYNVCSGKGTVIGEILSMLAGLSKIRVRILEREDRRTPWDVPEQTGDFTKLRNAAGWLPAIPLEQSLAAVLEYWRTKIRAGDKA
jgi:GDP-4-dehydro-6-deoxy-D-mannose reductase